MVDIQRGRLGTARSSVSPTRPTPAARTQTGPTPAQRRAAAPTTPRMTANPRGTGTGTSAIMQETSIAPTSYDGGDFSGGGYYGGAPAPAMTDEDYLGGDASYQATLAAMNAALQNYEADIGAQRKKYDVDYDQSLRTLGYRKPAGVEGAPDFKAGSWDLEDANTASGKSYQSQLGDFASRGILQSSLYDRARNDLMDQLTRQLTSVDTARTNFMDDLNRQITAYKTEDTQKRQQARMEALAGMAGNLGF